MDLTHIAFIFWFLCPFIGAGIISHARDYPKAGDIPLFVGLGFILLFIIGLILMMSFVIYALYIDFTHGCTGGINGSRC